MSNAEYEDTRPSVRSPRSAARMALSSGALLTVQECVELLPMHDGEARAWLRDHDLIRDLAGRPVVVWCDVLEALRKPVTRKAGSKLPRVSL